MPQIILIVSSEVNNQGEMDEVVHQADVDLQHLQPLDPPTVAGRDSWPQFLGRFKAFVELVDKVAEVQSSHMDMPGITLTLCPSGPSICKNGMGCTVFCI
jgi:hypothetical protein